MIAATLGRDLVPNTGSGSQYALSHPHPTTLGGRESLFPFHAWGNGSSESLSDLPKATQLANGTART